VGFGIGYFIGDKVTEIVYDYFYLALADSKDLMSTF